MKKSFLFILISLLMVSLLANCESNTQTRNSVSSNGTKEIKYIKATDKSYILGVDKIDIYTASEVDLENLSLVKYDKSFGDIKDESSAASIAAKVFSEVYKDCPEKEIPFQVKYNQNAEAWIVHGTLPESMVGGVGEIAIKKNGKVIMLRHSK